MTKEEKYEAALEQARKELKTCGSMDCDAARLIFRLFPQLRKSEDERIRKGLIEALKTSKTVGALKFILPESTREEAIAYLEKQKEQWIPTDGQRYALGMVIKHSNPEDESTKVLESLLDDLTKIANPKVAKWKEQRNEKQEKQKYYWKPTETDVALFNKAVTTNKTLTPAERAQLDIIRSKFGCCRAVNCNGIVQKEQNPVEWSDSFEEAVTDLIERAKQGKCDSLSPIEEGNKLLAIAKHGKVNQQKWSEEDVDMLNSCISSIEEAKENRYAYKETDGDTSYDHEIAWLKSLSPSWKPSEEQMEALSDTLEFMPDTFKPRCTLVTLQNDLKKLM